MNLSQIANKFNIYNDPDVYHNYFSKNKLKSTLLSTEYVSKYNIINDILDIICKYHGINVSNWSTTIKSDNIHIENSQDNNITYAILRRCEPNIYSFYDTILIDNWINLTDTNKQIYRYIFKVTEHISYDSTGVCSLRIGIISDKFNKNGKFTNIKELESIGFDGYGSSICWYTGGKLAWFIFKHCDYTENYKSIHWESFKINKGFNRNCYFMIEINGFECKLKIICDAINGKKKEMEMEIPDSLLNKIFENKRFKIGVSLYMNTPGSFGIGLVKI